MSDTNKPEALQYFNSNTQDKQLGVTEQGDSWVYPSGSQMGFVEVELPTLPGSPNPTERLHMRDFGTVVGKHIEDSMQRGYLKSGPQQGPAQVFAHYAAVAEGASLLTKNALTRMQELSKEFAAEPERDEYYKQVVRPWLHSLSPKRRR